MTERDVYNHYKQHSSKEAYVVAAVFIAMLIIALINGGWQDVTQHPVEVSIVLIYVGIFYYVSKITNNTGLAVTASLIWCAGVMYFVSAVFLPTINNIPLMPHTAIHDATNAFNQINNALR